MGRRTERLKDEVISRYKLLRAVHVCYFGNVEHSVDANFTKEFFYVCGDIIEGRPLDFDRLRYLSEDRLQQCLKEDRQ